MPYADTSMYMPQVEIQLHRNSISQRADLFIHSLFYHSLLSCARGKQRNLERTIGIQKEEQQILHDGSSERLPRGHLNWNLKGISRVHQCKRPGE